MIQIQFASETIEGVVGAMQDFLARCHLQDTPPDDRDNPPNDTPRMFTAEEVDIARAEEFRKGWLAAKSDSGTIPAPDPGWLAAQKLLKITGWDFPSRSGDQFGFGAIERGPFFGAWYVEPNPSKYVAVNRQSLRKGTTLEQAILDFVALNPELQAKWNAA